MTPSRNLLVFAALNGALGVTLGAFAAHGASPQVKTLLATGAQYQLLHAVLAVACALSSARTIHLAGWLGASGGLVFSLALCALGLLSLSAMGAVAPLGGLLMLAGWVLLAFAGLRRHRNAG